MTDILESFSTFLWLCFIFNFILSLFQALTAYVFAYLLIFLLNFERFHSFLHVAVVILTVSYLTLKTKWRVKETFLCNLCLVNKTNHTNVNTTWPTIRLTFISLHPNLPTWSFHLPSNKMRTEAAKYPTNDTLLFSSSEEKSRLLI